MVRTAPVPAWYIAQQLGVSQQLIRWWVTSGKLDVIGRNGRSPLYDWHQAVRVERDTRQHPQSRRQLLSA
jgi:hypothetical protein